MSAKARVRFIHSVVGAAFESRNELFCSGLDDITMMQMGRWLHDRARHAAEFGVVFGIFAAGLGSFPPSGRAFGLPKVRLQRESSAGSPLPAFAGTSFVGTSG